jgi:ATP adenylyltransferase
MQYIRSLGKKESGECFLCAAAKAADPKQRADSLVLWHSPHCMVLINRFPYTNGHLLIAPLRHVAELSQLSDPELLDMEKQTVGAIALLGEAMSPQGFNLGVNLGRCAGAGVPGHLHRHVVPRWGGDTNFMSVIADTRVIPEAIDRLYEELMQHVKTP